MNQIEREGRRGLLSFSSAATRIPTADTWWHLLVENMLQGLFLHLWPMGTYTVTSFTLVLEFKKGRLQNLYWKRDECSKCSGSSNFVCLNNQDCAIKTNSCKNRGQGSVDCSLGIQLAFSGTDKHDSVFNSWYEVKNLRQYSLYGLYSNLKDSPTSQYKFF